MTVGSVVRNAWRDLSPAAGPALLPLDVPSRPRLAAWLPHGLVAAGAVVLAGSSWHILLTDYALPNGSAATLSLVHASALVVCVFRPMAGWWLSLALATVTGLAVASPGPQDGPLWAGPSLSTHLAVLALVALRVPARVAAQMWALTGVAAVGLAVALSGRDGPAVPPPRPGPEVGLPGRDAFPSLAEVLLVSGTVVLAAAALRGRGDALRGLARERQRRALLEERARIARELHDVVAHHMSVVAVQAEAAPYRVAEVPDELARGFAVIRANALEAIDELHRVLGLLRAGDGPADSAPQPTLDGLDGLVDGLRATGLAVDLRVSGDRPATTPALEVSAYRIVQEALSNVLRHAPGADVEVVLAYRPDRIELTVGNGPSPGAPEPPAGGPGHGILGMRERAAMLGGELAARPGPDGGFTVTAVLPAGKEAPR
ncbi:sensor histidine kinase [Actinomadura algeriensis]|uniref:histidine kinase n=1 Tax=Actinomadura algeriensis TaxID=1679523 RepID=A0ABR9K4A1_9ACTN|nr:sensor histidine kinase [Actinomadura algeriensis]MBE1537642.1 signal transduction histidine kinase [Actinomadura algeriensis]